MTTVTIRNLDPTLKRRLRVRAAEHGHSTAEEARQILAAALTCNVPRTQVELSTRIRARFKDLGGVELTIPRREPPARE